MSENVDEDEAPPPMPSSFLSCPLPPPPPPPLILSAASKPDSNQFDVFISYNREFDQDVKTLYYELTVTYELNIWLDEFDRTPTSLTDENSKGIHQSKVFLCCCSKKYCDTSFCTDEFMLARRLKKPIAMLMLEKMNEFELGRIGPVVKLYTQIDVYEYEKRLLEPSKSELYDSIIRLTKYSLHQADHQALNKALSEVS